MVTNVSFVLLDAPVIAGRGDAPALGTMSHARLLEEVAALGGVLRHLGVDVGVPVAVDLRDDVDAVVGALAAARIGGVVAAGEVETAPVALVSEASGPRPASGLRLVRAGSVTEPDLDWTVMIRAGRTDPAACEVLDADAAYSRGRSVAEELEVLAGARAPYDPAALRDLLQV